jgi:hypothetical protein
MKRSSKPKPCEVSGTTGLHSLGQRATSEPMSAYYDSLTDEEILEDRLWGESQRVR